MAEDFEAMWGQLATIGRSSTSGGYFRQPFLSAETELRVWFVEQARSRGLRIEGDALGNLIAWWEPTSVRPSTDAFGMAPQGVLTGSHLDSVLDGGAYDGPLGVVSALAALDVLRSRGCEPGQPLGIAVFVEEEGSRFGVACLGSRLATGALSWTGAEQLRDRSGVFLGDALPEPLPGVVAVPGDVRQPGWDLSGVEVFIELHVEQGRGLVQVDAPIGVASRIWPHGRYRFDVTGRADHAGSTRMEDRADPMLTYAMTALAAAKQARVLNARATFGRVEVSPNSTNAIASRVTAWLDARAESDQELAQLVGSIERLARERAARDGTSAEATPESVSTAVDFPHDLASRIASGHQGRNWPILASQAGHDAGVLSAAGVPTAMLFVRNPTGVSHSPDESAEMADCVAGITALADTLERLLR